MEQGATKLLSQWQRIVYKRLFIRVKMQVAFEEDRKTLMAAFQCYFLRDAKEFLLLMAESFPELGVEA